MLIERHGDTVLNTALAQQQDIRRRGEKQLTAAYHELIAAIRMELASTATPTPERADRA